MIISVGLINSIADEYGSRFRGGPSCLPQDSGAFPATARWVAKWLVYKDVPKVTKNKLSPIPPTAWELVGPHGTSCSAKVTLESPQAHFRLRPSRTQCVPASHQLFIAGGRWPCASRISWQSLVVSSMGKERVPNTAKLSSSGRESDIVHKPSALFPAIPALKSSATSDDSWRPALTSNQLSEKVTPPYGCPSVIEWLVSLNCTELTPPKET